MNIPIKVSRVIIVVIAMAMSACHSERQRFELASVDKDTVIHVQSNKDNTTTMILKITGFVDDTCQLQGFAKFPGGDIDTTLKLDFYGKIFDLRYDSYKAKRGHLVVETFVP